MAEILTDPQTHRSTNQPSNRDRRGGTSASNALADQLCPGRHLASKALPDVRSDDSEFGTAIHEALKLNKPDALSAEQRDIFDSCQSIEAKLVQQFFGADAPKAKCYREREFFVEWNNGQSKLVHSCMADVVYWFGDCLLIMEFKSLPGDVPESSRNLQLRDQLCLVVPNFVGVNRGSVAVIQPLVTHSPEICVYEADDITRAAKEMFQRVLKSNDPNSQRIAGEVQCKFCKARSLCQEYQRYAGGMVPGMMNVLEVPVAQWTPEHRSIFCERVSVAETWLDATKSAMKEGLEKDPSFVPGFTLKPGNVVETITDPQACFRRFAGIGGTAEQFMGAVKVSKSKLKESVALVTGAKGGSLVKAMDTLTEGITESRQNKPSLAKVGE